MKKSADQGSLVSIVMPVYNGAEFIDDTIHSVLGQMYENWELIIVDDCSSDRTLEVIGQFSSEKIRVIACKKNGGAAKARNRGVRSAKGRYLCFLDADDLWQPDKLQRQIEFMKEKDCAFAYAGYVFADADGRPNGKVVRVPSEVTSDFKDSAVLISTVIFDLKKLAKDDLKMSDSAKETWQNVLRKVGSAYGLNEVMAIRGYQHGKKTFWGKIWRRG